MKVVLQSGAIQENLRIVALLLFGTPIANQVSSPEVFINGRLEYAMALSEGIRNIF